MEYLSGPIPSIKSSCSAMRCQRKLFPTGVHLRAVNHVFFDPALWNSGMKSDNSQPVAGALSEQRHPREAAHARRLLSSTSHLALPELAQTRQTALIWKVTRRPTSRCMGESGAVRARSLPRHRLRTAALVPGSFQGSINDLQGRLRVVPLHPSCCRRVQSSRVRERINVGMRGKSERCCSCGLASRESDAKFCMNERCTSTGGGVPIKDADTERRCGRKSEAEDEDMNAPQRLEALRGMRVRMRRRRREGGTGLGKGGGVAYAYR